VVIHSVPSLYEQRVAALLKNRMFLKAERPLKVLTQIEWRTPTGASSSSHRVIHAAGLDRWDGAYKRLLSFYTLPQDTYGQVPEHVAVLIRDTDLSSTERELLLREAEVSFRVTRNPTAEIREAALATKSTGSIITALPLMVELPGLPKDYARRLSAIVRNQLSYAGTLSEGHIAGVEADMLADGRIVHVVLTETSGDHEWDEAVLRAVVKTEFLPRGEDGLVPERAYFRFVQK
jgi:hypothetical protein